MNWVYRSLLCVSIALKPPLLAAYADEIHPSGANVYQKVTGDDSEDDRQHWDSLFSTKNYVFGKEPAEFLKANIALLPMGRVLDIAMGEGRNAVFMAKRGFLVDGVDFSEVALRKAKRLARENKVSIHTIAADLTNYSIKPESYEVILNIDYFQRSLISRIKHGLKKGGVVVFVANTVGGETQIPRDQLLDKGELRELFKDFQILLYRESKEGKDFVASLIAKKP